MKSGIQISSLKPLLQTNEQVQTALENCRGLGCRWVQLQWIHPSVAPECIARALENAGMRSVSVQDFYETVMADLSYYVELNRLTGGKWLCVSRIPDRLKSREGLDLFVAELRSLQQQLDGYSQTVCFHPVSADFAAVEDMDAVGYLLDAMPELELCLDLYHLNRNCGDMPGFIRRYGRRICMVHFKDEKDGALVPAGQGEVNWDGVVKACLEEKIPYGFVEQEKWERDPYDCMGEALTWLEEEIKKEENL